MSISPHDTIGAVSKYDATGILNGWRTREESSEILKKLNFQREKYPQAGSWAFPLEDAVIAAHEECIKNSDSPRSPTDPNPGDTKPAGDNQSSEGSLKGDNMWLIIFGAIAAIIAAVAGFTAPMWMPR